MEPENTDIADEQQMVVRSAPRESSDLYVPARKVIDGFYRRRSMPKYTMVAGTSHDLPETSKKLGQTAGKLQLLSSSLQQTTVATEEEEAQMQRRSLRLFTKHTAFVALAITIISLTGYVSVDTLIVNHLVVRQTAQALGAEGASTSGSNAIGTDQRPSEKPLPQNAVANYHVAGPNPQTLSISKIGLLARVLPMSVDTNGALQAPGNIFDTGWYTGSVQPGETGAVLIDAHSSGATKGGAFGRLSELNVGDKATIQTGDGKHFTYKVVAKEKVPRDKLNMQKALLPYGHAMEGLNLITCAGAWTQNYTTMADRLVVYMVRV